VLGSGHGRPAAAVIPTVEVEGPRGTSRQIAYLAEPCSINTGRRASLAPALKYLFTPVTDTLFNNICLRIVVPGIFFNLTVVVSAILDKTKPDTGNTKGLNLAAVIYTTVQVSKLPS
jgi:hypothetical protein